MNLCETCMHWCLMASWYKDKQETVCNADDVYVIIYDDDEINECDKYEENTNV